MAASDNNEKPGPLITSAHALQQAIRVVVVGAGGTGGRLIPGLMQVLRQQDSVAIVDGDHVEDRNLARQNFRQRDVGENKAEVMVRRYRREGIRMDAYTTMFDRSSRQAILKDVPAHRYVILGCVDNWRARVQMMESMAIGECLWIDGGNERRGGQAIMSSHHWPFKVKAIGADGVRMAETTGNFHVKGMTAMPQLLLPQDWHCDRCDVDNDGKAEVCKKCKQPEESCRDRIDLQTVAVNQLSATCLLNILSCVLYQVPLANCGAFFSTMNTMAPIKLDRVAWDTREIHPDKTYAG